MWLQSQSGLQASLLECFFSRYLVYPSLELHSLSSKDTDKIRPRSLQQGWALLEFLVPNSPFHLKSHRNGLFCLYFSQHGLAHSCNPPGFQTFPVTLLLFVFFFSFSLTRLLSYHQSDFTGCMYGKRFQTLPASTHYPVPKLYPQFETFVKIGFSDTNFLF